MNEEKIAQFKQLYPRVKEVKYLYYNKLGYWNNIGEITKYLTSLIQQHQNNG